MCLDYLRESNYKPTYGYKVFYYVNGQLFPEFPRFTKYGELYSCRNSWPENVWLSSGKGKIAALGTDWYSNGFHCFYTKKDAQSWLKRYKRKLGWYAVLKVNTKKVVAQGLQNLDGKSFLSVFVCKKIKIERR